MGKETSLKVLARQVLERNRGQEKTAQKGDSPPESPESRNLSDVPLINRQLPEGFSVLVCPQGRLHIVKDEYRGQLCQVCGRCEWERQHAERRKETK